MRDCLEASSARKVASVEVTRFVIAGKDALVSTFSIGERAWVCVGSEARDLRLTA